MTFDELLAITDLPSPGPELYKARRKLWLTPRQNDEQTRQLSLIAQHKLDALLNKVADDRVWNSSIGPAWKRISTGANLKQNIPMALMVKIIHTAWIRDETWPLGAVVPDSSDDVPPNDPS